MTSRRRLYTTKLRPATFAEAGVAAPFTTPTIVQARLRLGFRGQLEIVARNPTGADGMYVLPLKAAHEFFRLSIHDRAMVERLQGLKPISPLTIRKVALDLALEGLAGPDAKEAAVKALSEQEEHGLLTLLLLLQQLLAEAGQPPVDWKAFDTSDVRARELIKPYFKRLEPSFEIAVGDLATAVDALSALIAPVGLQHAPFKSMASTTLDELRLMQDSVASWGRTEKDDFLCVANLLVECATLTITCAEKSLEKASTLVQSVGLLLKAHATAPDAVGEVLTRPIWLLYAWRYMIALWQGAIEQSRDAQREVMLELGELVPLVPLEAEEWLDLPPGRPWSHYEIHRQVRIGVDWRTGTSIDRQAVVERVKAASL